MARRGFGDLEAVIMDMVWSRAEAVSVREIFDELSQSRQIAYTTVLSTMDNLHKKGWLARALEGKAYSYAPMLSRTQHAAALMREAFTACDDADAVLALFIEQMTADESARLAATLRRIGRRR